MSTIDYVYRFDPRNPSKKPPPPDAEVAPQEARRRQPDVREVDGQLPSQHADSG